MKNLNKSWRWQMLAQFTRLSVEDDEPEIWITFRHNDSWYLPLPEARELLRTLKVSIEAATKSRKRGNEAQG